MAEFEDICLLTNSLSEFSPFTKRYLINCSVTHEDRVDTEDGTEKSCLL